MTGYPPDSAILLVAVITQPRDLEIARVLGWYRIPMRFAPKLLDVDYLALYQTAAFGEQERWKINYILPVRGHELTRRVDLLRDEPDHPRAQEEYYKIQVGPLQPLPRPIQAEGWKRISFFYTTGELLRRAVSISDLVVKDEERALLWRGLRERALNSGSYRSNELPETHFKLDPALLAMLGELTRVNDDPSQYNA